MAVAEVSKQVAINRLMNLRCSKRYGAHVLIGEYCLQVARVEVVGCKPRDESRSPLSGTHANLLLICNCRVVSLNGSSAIVCTLNTRDAWRPQRETLKHSLITPLAPAMHERSLWILHEAGFFTLTRLDSTVV